MSKDSECIQCPFCMEKGFDKVGLKIHLQNYCDEFDKIEAVFHAVVQTK